MPALTCDGRKEKNMKKNEQLFRAIGKISPTYIEMAADGKVPGKKTRASAPWGRFRALGVIAAMIVLAAMMFALGLSVSATEPDPEMEEYGAGSMLMDIPEMILAEDFEPLLAQVQAGVRADTRLIEDVREHLADRFFVFFSLQSLQDQNSEKAREGLLRKYPIVEITNIYTVDYYLGDCERDFLHYMIVTYSDTMQMDLITYHQNMYDMAANSDLSEEKKQKIYDSLPDVPAHLPSAPPANYITEQAAAAGERQLTPLLLPYVLLAEDYEAIRDTVLAKYGVTNVEDLPWQAQQLLNSYTKYPLEIDSPENYHTVVAQHFAVVTADIELYILPPSTTIEQRIQLSYLLATEADVWEEDAMRMAKHLEDTIEERYPIFEENSPRWRAIMDYWGNWMYGHYSIYRQD
jgi:hypothetical protein